MVLSAVYGTAAAVFMPALTGLIPQTVGADRLQEANALLALTRSVGHRRSGPAIAGVVIALSGPGEAIAIDAATFVVSRRLPAARSRRGPLPAAAATGERLPRRSCARAGARSAAAAWLRRGLVAMAAYHVFVLPSVFVLGPVAGRRASSTARRAGRRSSPPSASGRSPATSSRCGARPPPAARGLGRARPRLDCSPPSSAAAWGRPASRCSRRPPASASRSSSRSGTCRSRSRCRPARWRA